MSFEAIIAKAKAASIAGGFSSSPPDNGEKYRTYSREPIPDFWERLPDAVIDPETKQEVEISQSRIKRFLRVIDNELCGKRFYSTTITEEYSETIPAAKLGIRFEYLALGTLGRDGTGDEPFLTASGSPTADEKRIRKNVEKAKQVIERMVGKDFSTQAKISIKCLEGSLDILKNDGDRVIVIDTKYSGLLDDNRTELSWPEDIREKEQHLIQGKHYSLLAEKVFGKPVDFYFLVFASNKRTIKEKEVFGIYRPYLLRISEEGMNEHKHMILEVIEQMKNMLEGRKFTARPSYSGCADCPVLTCKSRQSEPDLVIVEI